MPTTGNLRIEDADFSGGFSNARGYKGRTAQWVYAQDTRYSQMRANFSIRGRPAGDEDGNAALVIEGMDSENSPKTDIRIEINSNLVYEGENPLPNDTNNINDNGNWGSWTFTFPAEYLKQGNNRIEITNLEESGGFGRPPFFMLDYAVLRFGQIGLTSG